MLLANIGIPMVCVTVPTMLIALFPIAWVESLVYRASLDLSRKESFWGAFAANFWSTIIGIPIVWLPMVVVQVSLGGDRAWGMETSQQRVEAVTLQAPWLIPYREHNAWMVPAASLVLLLPFYLGSVVVEHSILRKRWPSSGQKPSFAIVMVANAISYIGMGAYWGFQLWWQMDGAGA